MRTFTTGVKPRPLLSGRVVLITTYIGCAMTACATYPAHADLSSDMIDLEIGQIELQKSLDAHARNVQWEIQRLRDQLRPPTYEPPPAGYFKCPQCPPAYGTTVDAEEYSFKPHHKE